MSKTSLLFAAALIALPVFAHAANPATMQLPARKAGLWSMSTAVGTHPAMTNQLCMDAATDRKLSVLGQGMGSSCSESSISRTPDGYKFHSVCSMMGGKTVSDGTAKGDFGSHYVVEANSTTTGSSMAAMNRASHMKIEARWSGPCGAGQKPGDMIMANGMKVNILSVPGMH